MNNLRKLERNLLTSIIVAIVSILGFIASSFLIYSESKDIPLGFLLSGGVIGGLYRLAKMMKSHQMLDRLSQSSLDLLSS